MFIHFVDKFLKHFSHPNYRVSVSDATITPHTLNFVKKLVSTFGIGVENVSSSVSGNSGNSGNDALQRRSQVIKHFYSTIVHDYLAGRDQHVLYL
jgi:hypothetical protein